MINEEILLHFILTLICIYDQDMRSDWAYLLFWDFRIAVKSKIKLSFVTVALLLWKNNQVLSRLILSFESLKAVIFTHILLCCDDRKPVMHTKNKEWHWDGPLNEQQFLFSKFKRLPCTHNQSVLRSHDYLDSVRWVSAEHQGLPGNRLPLSERSYLATDLEWAAIDKAP